MVAASPGAGQSKVAGSRPYNRAHPRRHLHQPRRSGGQRVYRLARLAPDRGGIRNLGGRAQTAGGLDWQRLLKGALRNKACKVLLVGTELGVQRQGVRNEIQIADTVGRSIGDPEFVIPLRLTNFDAPFLIAHAQYVDFKRSWADSLAEVLATLQEAENVPRKRDSTSETMDYWKQVYLRHSQSMWPTPEPLVTNWLSFEQLPETLYLFSRFKGPCRVPDPKYQATSPLLHGWRTPFP